jgi:hypothetical protein
MTGEMAPCLQMMAMAVLLCSSQAARGKDKNVDDNQELRQLLHTAADPDGELPARVRAVDALARVGGANVAAQLKQLLDRERPTAPVAAVNWDPLAAERVVDMHIVEALSLWGDNSQLDRLPRLIKAAGRVLSGPDDELENATKVVLRIGRVELIRQLVTMTEDPAPQVTRNAVVVLRQLQLPHPATGGPLAPVFQPNKVVTFEITTLKQELESIAALSAGKVVLSPGLKSFVKSHDYERGPVKREQVSLADLIERFIPRLDVDYYLTDRTVVLCTYAEAGQKWREWWAKSSARLTYQKESGRFVLLNH